MSVPRISTEELKERLNRAPGQTPIVIDVRLKYPFEHSTITLPGAVRLAPEVAAHADLPRDRDLVLYDSDPEELVSARIAAQLAQRGYRTSVLHGGIAAWANARYPTESKPAPQLSTSPSGASLKT